jgi:hypothetical protein
MEHEIINTVNASKQTIALMVQDIAYIKEDIKAIRDSNRERHQEVMDAIHEMGEKKAGVWVEKVIWVAVTGICTAAAALVWAVTTNHI